LSPHGRGESLADTLAEHASAPGGLGRVGHGLDGVRAATALPDGRLLLVGGRTELIVSKWSLRWSRTLRLRGDLRRAARREPTGAIDPSLGAHGSRAP
jgi:hypothetical protein